MQTFQKIDPLVMTSVTTYIRVTSLEQLSLAEISIMLKYQIRKARVYFKEPT